MRLFQSILRGSLQRSRWQFEVGWFGLIVAVLMNGAPSAVAMDNQTLIKSIRDHDSQINDLEYESELSFDKDPGQAQKPGALSSLQYTWRWKGEKHYRATSHDGVLRFEDSYDGQQARSLAHALEDMGSPSGGISRKPPRLLIEAIGSPWYVAGRTPYGESLLEALEDGRATVHPEPVVEQEHECYLVEGHLWNHPERGPGGHFKLWLDPKCGFMPRRREEFILDEQGQLTVQNLRLNYELAEVAPGVWFPMACDEEGWELEDGQLHRFAHNRYRVKSPVRINQGLSDDQFVVDFPMGTRVQDFIDPTDDELYIEYVAAGPSVEEHLEGMSALIVQAVATEAGTGAKKAIPSLPELSADSQVELEDAPLASGTGRARRSPFLLAGGVGLACLGLIMLAVLWKRRPALADSAFENNVTEQEV